MKLGGLSTEEIKAGLRRAEARVQAAVEEYEAAKAEVAWLQQGLRLVDPKAAAAMVGQDMSALVTELFPDGVIFENGTTPTLRQAIVLAMRDNPQVRAWSMGGLAQALERRGWLPMRESSREILKRVSDMAGVMYADGQLERPSRGVYKLAPHLSAALEVAGGRQE